MKDKACQLINKLQEYLKIDLFYLIEGESWLILGKVISLFAAFLLSLAWANWIDKEIYGSYQYILSLVGILSLFSLPEMSTAVAQAVARKFEGSLVSGFKTQIKWGILGSLACLGIGGYYWLQNDKLLAVPLLIISVFLPLFNASIVYLGFFTGRKMFNTRVKFDSITEVISVSLMALTLLCVKTFLTDIPVYLILSLIFIVYFTSRTSLRFFFYRLTETKYKENSKEDPKTVSFGKHLSFSGLVDVVASNLDKILLFHYLGAIELAIYSFAVLLPKQINMFIKHISSLAFPKFSVRSRRELRENVLKKIYYLVILISLIVLAYIIVAPLFYHIFFPKYVSSIPYSRLYALSIIPLCFSLIGGVFRAKMMIKELYQIRIITPIIRTCLLFILIPAYGIWGAVWAILLARTINSIIILFFFRKV